MDLDLTVVIAGNGPRPLVLRNPVMSAAGTFGYGLEYARLLQLDHLGAIVTKSTTLRTTGGAPMPRFVETPSGMLNAVGLNNPGIEKVLKSYAPKWEQLGAPVVLSIAGEDVDEYVSIAMRAEEAEVIAGLELNLSCPNVVRGDLLVGSDPEQAAEVTEAVRAVTSLPLIVKLPPNALAVSEVARAVEEAGADAVSLINMLPGLVIDTQKRGAALGNVTGGLSGPAIRPVAVRMVREVARWKVRIPVIGLGGITDVDDALQFIMAGASAVQVGSASFGAPATITGVAAGLEVWMREAGVGSIGEIRGCAVDLDT